jgi:hypothetical protein
MRAVLFGVVLIALSLEAGIGEIASRAFSRVPASEREPDFDREKSLRLKKMHTEVKGYDKLTANLSRNLFANQKGDGFVERKARRAKKLKAYLKDPNEFWKDVDHFSTQLGKENPESKLSTDDIERAVTNKILSYYTDELFEGENFSVEEFDSWLQELKKQRPHLMASYSSNNRMFSCKFIAELANYQQFCRINGEGENVEHAVSERLSFLFQKENSALKELILNSQCSELSAKEYFEKKAESSVYANNSEYSCAGSLSKELIAGYLEGSSSESTLDSGKQELQRVRLKEYEPANEGIAIVNGVVFNYHSDQRDCKGTSSIKDQLELLSKIKQPKGSYVFDVINAQGDCSTSLTFTVDTGIQARTNPNDQIKSGVGGSVGGAR